MMIVSLAGLLGGGLSGCSKAADGDESAADTSKESVEEQQEPQLGGGSGSNLFGFSAREFSFPSRGGSAAVAAGQAWDISLQGWLADYLTFGTVHTVRFECEVPQDTVMYALCRDSKDLDELYLRSNLGSLPVPGMDMTEFLKKYPEATTLPVKLWKNPLQIETFSCTVNDPVLYSKDNPVQGFIVRVEIDGWVTLERKFSDWYEIVGEIADSRVGDDLRPVATYLQYRIREDGDFKGVLTVAPNTTGVPRSMIIPVGSPIATNECFTIEQQ